jgi:hypothetical protein
MAQDYYHPMSMKLYLGIRNNQYWAVQTRQDDEIVVYDGPLPSKWKCFQGFIDERFPRNGTLAPYEVEKI